MISNQYPICDTVLTQSVAQFQALSPVALRQHITELNRNQEELKERMRQQEQATRNAVGVSIVSAALAAASISVTLCLRAKAVPTGTPVAVAQTRNLSHTTLASVR